MTTIQKLPVEVRSYLRSGVTVTSVTQCVEELLLNSVDAGATCVAVRVDLQCFKIQVVDNGSGIAQDQLKLLGERYATSKCHSVTDLENLTYFGYRGEALASIRESCSVLEITTKTKDSSKTYSKLFQDGRPLEVIESTIPRPSVGTTVTVHDLFSSFPVRRKSTNTSLELERIRQRVEALALLRPSVSVSLRNDSSGVILVQTHKCNNSLLTFKHLFGAAKADSLSEVNSSKSYFTVEGYLGKEGHSKKEVQFVYVNGRLVLKTRIHKLVNKMLINSAIFKRKYGSKDISPNVESKSVFVKSPGRQLERYPVFFLNVKCPLTKYDITFDPSKTLIEFTDWDSLLELTKDILNDFLKKENLVCQEGTVSTGEVISDCNAKSAEKGEKKMLSNIISPSNLRHTLFSKPAKRKSEELNQFKTPVSISVEEWKAENKTRKLLLNETETADSINRSDVTLDVQSQSDSAATECSVVTEESQVNDKIKINDTKEPTESSDIHQSRFQKKQSMDKIQLTKYNRPIENMGHLHVVNEKGDSNPSQRVLELQKLQNKASGIITQNHRTDQTYEPLGRSCASTDSCEGSTITVSKTSKSSLSEFRRRIGKSVTDATHTVSVDERLNEHFKDKLGHKTAQEVKYTSSLQKFKKQFVNHEQSAFSSRNETSHDNRSNFQPSHEYHKKQASMLNKSGISVTDSRMNNYHICDEKNNFQNAKNDQNYPLQSFPGLSFDSNMGDPTILGSTDDSSADKVGIQSICDRNQGTGYNSVIMNRKRAYPANEKETVAYKLSRLSKQKTATISVTSTCGPSRSPLNAEIYCGDNAVVTFVAKSNDSPMHRNFQQPPCATVISDDMNTEFHVNPMFDTGTAENNFQIPDFSEYSKNCDINQPELFSTHNPFEERQNSDIDVLNFENTGRCLEKTNYSKFCEQDNVVTNCDIINFTAEKLQDKLVATDNNSLKDLDRSSNVTVMTDNVIMEETVDSDTQCFELSRAENSHTHTNELDEQIEINSSLNVKASSNSEPFEFSTQGFSPCMNGSETGLSQTMNDINICVSPKLAVDAEQLPPIIMSPCSMGFSPCMSLSPASLPDGENGSSQGFAAIRDDQQDQLTTGISEDNDNADVLITAETDGIVTKSNSINDTDQKKSSMDGFAEKQENNSVSKSVLETTCRSEQISSSRYEHDSNELNKRDQPLENSAILNCDTFEPVENSSNVKAVPNAETESNSEDIFTNKTVRISQLLPSTSQPRDAQSSCTDSTKYNSDIHFTDIFPPSTSESNGHTCELDNTESSKNETDKDKLQCKNTSDIKGIDQNVSCSVVENSVGAGANYVDKTDVDANDDTMLQPTPENSSLFSSWDCSCGSFVLDRNVAQENGYHETIKPTKHLCGGLQNNDELDKTSTDVQLNSKVTANKHDDRENDDTVTENNNSEKDGPEHDVKTITEHRKWIQMNDPKTGKKLYVHSLLGTSVTEEQWKASHRNVLDNTVNEASVLSKNTPKEKPELPALTPNTTKRLHTLMSDYIATGGKGTSENDGEEEDEFIKWRGTHTPDCSTQGPTSVEELFAEWSNPVFESTDKDVINTEVSALPKNTVKAYRSLNSCKFTKEMLNTVKVIGQVDKKFIACLLKTDPAKSTRPDMLAVIDQHAAHERIRLELLTEESYAECDVESGVLEVFKIEPAKCMELTGDEVRIMTSFVKEFNRIGVNYHCDPQSRIKIFIETIPACIMEKDVNYVKSTRENIAWNIVKALLKEHIDLLVSTGGVGRKLPSVLHKALCSQACHGAIKFGDSLTLRECEALIRDLSRCDLPFQCAHGRPSVMPVLQLEQLRTKLPQEKQRKPKLYKLSNAIQRDQDSAKP